METRDALRKNIEFADHLVQQYIADLSDEDLLVRPVPGTNHIAWQLGHLIVAENGMMEAAFPGSMPPLAEDFKAKYTNDTASSDDPKAFHRKAEYLAAMKAQRTGTLANLEKVSNKDLDADAPEQLRSFLKTMGDVFVLQGGHWLMHVGQWAVVRRKLGRKPLF